jgi:hypothetical protein
VTPNHNRCDGCACIDILDHCVACRLCPCMWLPFSLHTPFESGHIQEPCRQLGLHLARKQQHGPHLANQHHLRHDHCVLTPITVGFLPFGCRPCNFFFPFSFFNHALATEITWMTDENLNAVDEKRLKNAHNLKLTIFGQDQKERLKKCKSLERLDLTGRYKNLAS